MHMAKANHNTELFFSSSKTSWRRRQRSKQIEGIRSERLAVKLKVIQNLIDNIKDQNQENTVIEYASAFGFKRSACSKTKKIEYLKKLFSIYGKDAMKLKDLSRNTQYRFATLQN